MYCSTCGHQIAEHLNYCNSCGARIEKNLVVSDASSKALSKTLSVMIVVGLIGFVAVCRFVLDSPRLDVPAMVVILVSYLATLVLISAIIIGHMWKSAHSDRIGARHAASRDNEYVSPKSFRGTNTNQLGEPVHQSIGSVTDSTTRTLDEVLVERR